MPSPTRSASAARTFDVISAVATHGGTGVGLTDLARHCDMAPSSCHRYVATLVEIGVLDREASGLIRLGLRLITLAGSYLESDAMRAVAHPYMADLVASYGETCHLGRYLDDQVVYVDKVECDKSIRLVSRIGATVPVHCSSMGKAILAKLPSTQAEPFIVNAKERRTEHTLTGQALRDEIAHVAEQGWAMDDQENELGVRCVGVAIATPSGSVIGALSVSGLTNRFSPADCHRIAPDLIKAATAIGAHLY
jgi:DNA-binding IclR family transcriptional regulator